MIFIPPAQLRLLLFSERNIVSDWSCGKRLGESVFKTSDSGCSSALAGRRKEDRLWEKERKDRADVEKFQGKETGSAFFGI